MVTKISRGFEPRWCHKNFTKTTFSAISKNVKYRSVACLWPKLWSFWVLQLLYICTTIQRNPELLRSYDGTTGMIDIRPILPSKNRWPRNSFEITKLFWSEFLSRIRWPQNSCEIFQGFRSEFWWSDDYEILQELDDHGILTKCSSNLIRIL